MLSTISRAVGHGRDAGAELIGRRRSQNWSNELFGAIGQGVNAFKVDVSFTQACNNENERKEK